MHSSSEIIFPTDSVVTFSFHLQRKSENFLTSLFASYMVRHFLKILLRPLLTMIVKTAINRVNLTLEIFNTNWMFFPLIEVTYAVSLKF